MQIKRNTRLFFAGKAFFRFCFNFIFRGKTEGAENIPKNGGVIIAPNHISAWDPPLAGAVMERPLNFMAKQELFDIPVLGFIIRRTNAFPVKRGRQDMSAMRNAFALLESGNVLLMFPEGTRSKDGKIGKARAGVGMVSCHAQVPVVPVRIENTNKIFKFRKIKIKFGLPIYPPKEFSKDDYLKISQKALDAIESMSSENR